MDDLLSQDEINALLSGDELPAVSSDLSMEDAQVLDEVAAIFSNAESSVFGMLAGKEVSVQAKESMVCTQAEFRESVTEKPFIFRATCGGFDDVPLSVVVDDRGAMALADLMMGGEGKELPEETSELYSNAAQEGLSQVVGSAFTNLSGLLGGRRLMPENGVSVLGEGDWKPIAVLEDDGKIWASAVSVNIEGLDSFTVRTAMPLDSAKSMVNTIHQIMGEKPQQPAQQQQTAPASSAHSSSSSARPTPASAASSPSFAPPPPMRGAQQPAPVVDVHPAEFTPLMPRGNAGSGGRIDLIADIPVRVTVELGKTRKNVSEILALSNGSVIELDKMAGEPVDVLVNGKLIAKGEVVVIDENFGVRIVEVMNAAKAYSA